MNCCFPTGLPRRVSSLLPPFSPWRVNCYLTPPQYLVSFSYLLPPLGMSTAILPHPSAQKFTLLPPPFPCGVNCYLTPPPEVSSLTSSLPLGCPIRCSKHHVGCLDCLMSWSNTFKVTLLKGRVHTTFQRRVHIGQGQDVLSFLKTHSERGWLHVHISIKQ